MVFLRSIVLRTFQRSVFVCMGYKRTAEQATMSCKRRKTSITSNVKNGRQYLVEILRKPKESEDSSSESCTEFSDSFTSHSKSGVKEVFEECISEAEITQCVAVDCEMVGVGDNKSSALARCSVVNHTGEVLFDAFVKPEQPVTDYRTKWSGIRESDLKEALSFQKARKQVKKIIKNCTLIGHSVQCDLHALNIFHPWHLLRDTSRYQPIRLLAGLPVNETPSLKKLSSILLRQDIQDNEHCSVEDARAAMALYKLCESQWEKEFRGELSNMLYLSDIYWPSWTQTGNST